MRNLCLFCFICLIGVISCKNKKLETIKILNVPESTTNLVYGTTNSYWSGVVTSTNLFVDYLLLQNNSSNVVEIRYNGEVIYDTNNVSIATQIFWEYLSTIIKAHHKLSKE
jgi:hypothetical protein